MRRLVKTALLLLLISWLSPLDAQDAEAKKVLFVGNSYTYFWNLPQQVTAMAESREQAIVTRQSTSGGVHLGQHWRGEKGLHSVELIKNGDFDVVIIQDHSMRSVEAPDSLLHYGRLFGQLARQSGAKPYLYLTWAREWDPYMQEEITTTYTQLAQQIDAAVIPVGLAWSRARQLRPDLQMFDPDGSHPSPMGTYLTACVVYGTLSQTSPVGLPNRLITVDKDGEKLYLNIQSEQDALFCQKVAEEVIKQQSK